MSEAGAQAAQRRSKGRARGKWRLPHSTKPIELGALALALALALPKSAQAEATGGEGGANGGFTGGTGGSAGAAGAASGSVSGGAAGTSLSPNGANGNSPFLVDGGGGGGGGGYSPTYSGDITTTSQGGDGGTGGAGGFYYGRIGGGGGGGGGGDGARITATDPVSVSADAIGGKGGAGGASGAGGAGNSGGGGGAGVVLTLNGALSIGAGSLVEIWGGEGGARGGSSNSGGGGGGGAGVLLLAGGTLNISGATIEGGPGRNDSNGGVAVKFDQAGSVTVEAGSSLTGGGAAYTGTGGSGLMMLHGGTITNAGAITGGTSQGWATGNANGGSAGGLGSGGADGYLPSVALQGFGGVGILGAGLSIINSGSIAGGSGHLGLANAIALSGDNNRLELHSGSIITGNVVVSGGGADNVFALGGTAASSFDASKLVDMVSPDVDDEYAGFTAFEKVGSSTWTLTGTSLFDGPISIDAGSLLINGAMTSATTTVATGALLGGDGQTGAVTIEAGGELSPGNSAGTITTGSLVIDAGGRLLIEFGNLIYDKVSVTGTVDLSGAELVLTALPGFTSKTGDSFIIIDNDGVDAVIGEFGGGDTVSLAGRSLKISYAGGTDNDVVLTDVTPAPPEPPAITLDQVKAAHVNVLGLPLPDAAAARVVSDIRSGSYSFDGYIGTLIDQADMSTLPAVIVNALLAGVTPTQSHLPELGAFATLQFDAYQETDSANPALGIYEALGLGFSEAVKFQGDYGGLSDVQFLTEAYQDVFGRAASTIQIAHFEAQLSYFEGLYAGAGQSDQLADLHAKGAIIGQMIGHAALDEPELHSFDDAAIAFLRAAGHGQAHYGEALALV